MPPKGKKPEPEPEEDEEIMEEEDEEPKKSPVEVLNELPLTQRKLTYMLKANHKDLRSIHDRYDAELKALEIKYSSLAAPLFEERRKIVLGEREPTADEIAAGEKTVNKGEIKVEAVEEPEEEESRPRRGVGAKKVQEKSPATKADTPAATSPAGADDSKGIPNFWLEAVCNNEVIMDSVTPRDREALAALLDVSYKYVDNDPFKGYILTFVFGPNRFFSNTVLTKTYFQERDNDEPILSKTESTKVDWKSKENNLTVIIKKKQQKHRTKKTVRTVEQEVKCDSFFNFFDPPRIPQEDDAEEEEDEDVDYEELEARIEYDYEIGNAFKDRLIPRAVDYFTAAALANTMTGMFGGQEAPEAQPVEPTTKPNTKAIPPTGGSGGKGPGGKQEDCKQQ
eukprot:PhF_6_TR39038/c0_g1_i1/m.58425/K11279/NAP1L1, NRP; nucleosome assembly protein 1-like 1